MMMSIRVLTPVEWSPFGRHLKRLSSDDRRMRFGSTVSDGAIDGHVDGLRPFADTVIAAFSEDADLIGAALVTRDSSGSAEISVSVERQWRGRGIGTALMRRATLWARNRGYRDVAVRFLSENTPMFRLSRRCGMRVAKDLGDAEGRLALDAPTWLSRTLEWTEETRAIAIYALAIARVARRWYVPTLVDPLRPYPVPPS